MLLLVAGGLVVLAPGARATSVTFSTTADFDAGTKSNPGGGNYGVETATDNPAVPNGGLSLGNLYGDNFSLGDSDSDTVKWNLVPVSGTCSGLSRVIGGGMDYFNVSDATAKSCREGIVLSQTLTGNLDVSFEINRLKFQTATGVWLCLMNELAANSLCYSGATIDGTMYQIERSGANASFALSAFKVTNGAPTTQGSLTTIATNPEWVRLTNSGNTWTWYYSPNGVSWTQDEQVSFTVSGVTYVMISSYSSGSTTPTVSSIGIDDFHISTGTFTTPTNAYQTIGNWKSPGQTPTSDFFHNIFTNYTGGDATDYISAVSLIDGSGNYRWTDTTHVHGGGLHIYTIPSVQASGAWLVQMNLTTDGDGSPIVEDMTIVHNPNVAPVITDKITQDSVGCSAPYVRDFNATDPDTGQTLTWSMVTDASGIVVGSANGTVYGIIAATAQYFVNVSVSDSLASDFDNYTLTITCTEIVVTEAATTVGHSSAVLNANLTFIGDVDGFAQVQFDYGRTLSFGFTTNLVTQHGTGNFSALVYDLDPGITYYFRAVAVGHSAGVSNGYGAVLSFTTTGGTSTFDVNTVIFAAFMILFLFFVALGFIVDFPPLISIGGIVGIAFGFWFFTATGFGIIPIVLWAVGALFLLVGILYMFGMGD